MGQVIGQSLGNALGVAISPAPIIALILMLFSKAAVRNSVAFAVGWVTGLVAVGSAILLIRFDAPDGGPSDAAGVVKLAVGALFLLLAVTQWRGRPRPGDAAAMPPWMAAVDHMSTPKAGGLGLLLAAANPKNLGLTVAAAVSIGANATTRNQEVIGLAVFVIIASSTILLPVLTFLIAGERARPMLNELKEWLVLNNSTVMTVVLAVLGAKVLGDGMTIVF